MRLIAHMLIGEDKMMWGSNVSVVWGVGIAAVLPSRCELSSLLVCCAEPRYKEGHPAGGNHPCWCTC